MDRNISTSAPGVTILIATPGLPYPVVVAQVILNTDRAKLRKRKDDSSEKQLTYERNPLELWVNHN